MPRLNPGAVIAGYQVERLLGRGGMGDVYLARHPRLPRHDALKIMSEELSRNGIYRQRFSSEADLACQVSHESVVRVYDRGEDGDRLWLAMEYVDGRDLADIIAEEGRLPVPRAVALLERIAAGLDAIHARGLLHRDVKPANILVTRDVTGAERALLTDFGIARSAADSLGLTGVDDIVATLHYASPEQFQMRSGDLDRRVDVYALGCVLYEMLTGDVPLKGDSVAGFWNALQTVSPAAPSSVAAGVPASLDAVVARALSKDRDRRFATAGDLARAAAAAIRQPAVAPQQAPAPIPETTLVDPKAVANSGGAAHGGSPPANVYSPASPRPGYGPPPGRTGPGSATPHLPPLPPPPAQPARKRRRGLLIGGVIALLVIAGGVVGLVLALGGGKKPVPGVPTDLAATAGRGVVDLTWHAGVGVTDHYVVYRDGKSIASDVTGVKYTDKLGDTDPHTFAVQAVNAAGRTSALSSQLTQSAEVRELNAAEHRLLDKLPTTLVNEGSCEPIQSTVDSRLDRAITCRPNPFQQVDSPAKLPETLNVYSAPTRQELTLVLNSLSRAHSTKSGDCSSPPQNGTWNFTQTPNSINGQIICYVNGDTSYLLWSYDAQRYYVEASTKSSYTSLREYWLGASLRLP